MAESEQRMTELAAEARHARKRYELYRAKSYGPRASSPGRLRELKRTSDISQLRLAQAAEAHS